MCEKQYKIVALFFSITLSYLVLPLSEERSSEMEITKKTVAISEEDYKELLAYKQKYLDLKAVLRVASKY